MIASSPQICGNKNHIYAPCFEVGFGPIFGRQIGRQATKPVAHLSEICANKMSEGALPGGFQKREVSVCLAERG